MRSAGGAHLLIEKGPISIVMNKNEMAEALYALPDGVVVKGRKPLTLPSLLTAAGAAMLIVNVRLPAAAGFVANVKSALVLLGAAAFAAGAVSLLVRLCGRSGRPLYGARREPLIWSERYFTKADASAVADCLARRDWTRLRAMPQSDVPAVRVVAFRTADDAFVACQAFEYAELEERPLTRLQIVRRD